LAHHEEPQVLPVINIDRREEIMKRFTVGALIGVFVVWASGAVWNWNEQTELADYLGFGMPWLLPFLLDGLALSLAAVATSASLDGRAGVVPRIGTLVAISASAAVSGYAAYVRSIEPDIFTGAALPLDDPVVVLIGAGAPIVALIAFEVLLTEVRRMVQKARGRQSPAPIPYPRLIRWILAPWKTFFAWRTIVLDLTDRELEVVRVQVASMPVVTSVEVESLPAPAPVRSTSLAPRAPRPVISNVELDAERRSAAVSIVREHAEGNPHKISRDVLAEMIRNFDTGNGHRLSCPNAVASMILNDMRERYVG